MPQPLSTANRDFLYFIIKSATKLCSEATYDSLINLGLCQGGHAQTALTASIGLLRDHSNSIEPDKMTPCPPPLPVYFKEVGAGDEGRTRDFQLGKLTLYH